MNLSWWCFP